MKANYLVLNSRFQFYLKKSKSEVFFFLKIVHFKSLVQSEDFYLCYYLKETKFQQCYLFILFFGNHILNKMYLVQVIRIRLLCTLCFISGKWNIELISKLGLFLQLARSKTILGKQFQIFLTVISQNTTLRKPFVFKEFLSVN